MWEVFRWKRAALACFALWFVLVNKYLLQYYFKAGAPIHRHVEAIPTSEVNITATFGGRLGNHLFEYASLIALAKKNGMQAVTPSKLHSDLYVLFPSTDGHPKIDWDKESKGYTVIEEHGNPGVGYYDKQLEDVTESHDITGNVYINGTLQSYKYFKEFEEEIREEYKFAPDMMKRPQEFLNSLKSKDDPSKQVAYVGIHIRRGDFLWDFYKKLGYIVAPKAYFQNAMSHMKKKHKDVRFVVATNDLPWAQKTLGSTDVFYSPFTSATDDLVLISLCDHVILSVGSFGWWAAWLANGEAIYYPRFPIPGSSLGKAFRKEDYYPPHWLAME